MKNVLFLIFSLSILFLVQQPLMAKDEQSTKTEKSDIDKITKQVPSAITLGIVDGIIRSVKNDRSTKIRLQWDPLPVSKSLRDKANESDFEVTTLEISNGDIETGNWIRNTSNEKLEKLRVALNVPNLNELSLNSPNPDGLKDLNRALKISDYIHMQRERNIVKILLLSKGLKYSFVFKPQEDAIVPPDFSDKNIKWQISIYSFKSNQALSYRFAVKAVVEPFERKILRENIIPKEGKEKVFYDARFKLNKSDQISSIVNNLFLSPKSANLELPVPSDDERKTIGADTEKAVTTSLTSLSGFFSFLGGSDQFGTTVQGLLGGTENTSIVGGGLIGFKKGGISSLIGINQDLGQLSDDISGGFLFGVGLGEKTSLFLGPSIRSSLFTLSAGAILGTEANAEVNFGSMIAIDLSRLTNSKKDNPPISISSSSQGGGLDQISDSIINKYTVIQYQSDRDVSMTKVCDENSILIPVEARKSPITLRRVNKETREYIIRGFYEYKSTDGKNTYYLNAVSDELIEIKFSSTGEGAKKIPCIVNPETKDKLVK